MSEKTDLVAGMCVRVWRYYCAGCSAFLDVEDVGHNLTSERAAMLRANRQVGARRTPAGSVRGAKARKRHPDGA